MNNLSIKEKIRSEHIFQWEVAEAVGVSEMTLIRWLRRPLPTDKEIKVLEAIETVKKNHSVPA